LKKFFIFIAITILVINASTAFASDSCSTCPSKDVCSDPNGGSCNKEIDAKATNAAPKIQASATTEISIQAGSIAAKIKNGASNTIIKLKGDKAALDSISAVFSGKFISPGHDKSECEITNVASELWIKIKKGSEPDKIDFLKSLGIKIEEPK